MLGGRATLIPEESLVGDEQRSAECRRQRSQRWLDGGVLVEGDLEWLAWYEEREPTIFAVGQTERELHCVRGLPLACLELARRMPERAAELHFARDPS